jgi:hypothetical protein
MRTINITAAEQIRDLFSDSVSSSASAIYAFESERSQIVLLAISAKVLAGMLKIYLFN